MTSSRTTPQVTPVKLADNFDAVSGDRSNSNAHVSNGVSAEDQKVSVSDPVPTIKQSNSNVVEHQQAPKVVVPDAELLQPNGHNNTNVSNSSSAENSPRGVLPPPSNSSSSIALNIQNFIGAPKMTSSNSTNSFYPESNGDSIESLKNEILLLRSDRNNLQIELANLRTETEAAEKSQKADIRKLRDLVKKLEDDKLIMAQKIDSLDMDLLRKKRENDLRAKETEKLTEELEALKKRSDGTEDSILNKSVDAEGGDFLQKLRQVEDEYRALEGELEALNQENKEVYREREELSQELETAKANAARYKQKSENLEKLIGSLQRDQSLSRQGSNVSMVSPDDLKLENEELKKSVDDCFAKIAELEAKESSYKKDLAAAAELTRQKVKGKLPPYKIPFVYQQLG